MLWNIRVIKIQSDVKRNIFIVSLSLSSKDFEIYKMCQDKRKVIDDEISFDGDNTSIHMQSRLIPEAKPKASPVDDTDSTKEARGSSERRAGDDAFHKSIHPRIQVLRISSLARSRSSTLGITPPYCPGGPPLIRSVGVDQADDYLQAPSGRQPSPLRNLALSNYSRSGDRRYDSPISI